MDAYQAMVTILDINEAIEQIKDHNRYEIPNQLDCKCHDLLEKFRDVLIAEMKSTELKVFTDENK